MHGLYQDSQVYFVYFDFRKAFQTDAYGGLTEFRTLLSRNQTLCVVQWLEVGTVRLLLKVAEPVFEHIRITVTVATLLDRRNRNANPKGGSNFEPPSGVVWGCVSISLLSLEHGNAMCVLHFVGIVERLFMRVLLDRWKLKGLENFQSF